MVDEYTVHLLLLTNTFKEKRKKNGPMKKCSELETFSSLVFALFLRSIISSYRQILEQTAEAPSFNSYHETL